MAERRKHQIDEFFIPVKKTQTGSNNKQDEQAFENTAENTDVNNNSGSEKDGRSTPTNVDQPGPAERRKRQIDEFFIPVKKTQTGSNNKQDEQAFENTAENTDVNNNSGSEKDGRSTPTNVDQPAPALTLSTNVRPNQTNVNVVTLSNRTTRREWFTRFPWLKMEQKENNDQKLFLCNFCISAG